MAGDEIMIVLLDAPGNREAIIGENCQVNLVRQCTIACRIIARLRL
jgi:hypothetical protein